MMTLMDIKYDITGCEQNRNKSSISHPGSWTHLQSKLDHHVLNKYVHE